MEFLFSSGARIISDTGGVIILIGTVISIPMILLCFAAESAQKHHYDPSEKTAFRRFSFLQQIPFGVIPEILHFTAGFLFFNDLVVLHGEPFLMISDLGVPDGMILVDGLFLNILPILVFVIHIVSHLIRVRDLPAIRKIMMWAVSILYLSLLYNSSSGYTIYWLIYEFCYLAISAFYRRMPAEGVAAKILSPAGLFILVLTLLFRDPDPARKSTAFLSTALVFQVPLILFLLQKKGILSLPQEGSVTSCRLFGLSCFYITLLTGIQIPSMVIRSAPSDFISISNYYSPFHYILSAMLTAAGAFIIWPGIAFLAASAPVRDIFAFLSAFFAVGGTVNVMFFGNDRGIMSTELVYDIAPVDTAAAAAVNLIILALIASLLFEIRRRKEGLLNFLISTLCIIKIVSAAVNCVSIAEDLSISKKTIASVQKASAVPASDSEEPEPQDLPEIPLSADGKNVVVLMMDRSIGYFLPFIMAERPELLKQFDGFTFYPNTVSFGSKTNEASPALFGGYEYTPERINERLDESLASKHNEALLLMPALFAEAGYRVTVVDPPYAGYQTIPNLDIYDEYPEIRAWHAEEMLPLSDEFYETKSIMDHNRNFFCYSICRISPLFLQPAIYSNGTYNKADTLQSFDDMLTASRNVENFQKAYNVLVSLPEMTVIEESGNTFFIMDNKTTHEPTLLQMPDYTLTNQVDNTPYETLPITRTSTDGRILRLDDVIRENHYHVNMGAFIAIGTWLDHLKENHVYDNTRIIIVSDHGHPMGYSEFMFGSKDHEDVLTFNPILMVKDFGQSGFSVDEHFMTNADTPVIAFDGLIDDPVNPATGIPVTNEDKYSRDILIKNTEIWDVKLNNGDDFLPGDWYHLHGEDIFDVGKWEYIGRH